MELFLAFCGVYFLIGLVFTGICIYKDNSDSGLLAMPFIILWPLILGIAVVGYIVSVFKL